MSDLTVKPYTPNFTVADVVAKVRELAAANPTFEYRSHERQVALPASPTCSYLPDEWNPLGCIVGAALRSLGVPEDVLRSHEGLGAGPMLSALFGDRVDHVVDDWFTVLQQAQDTGHPWGEAVATADEYLHDDYADELPSWMPQGIFSPEG